jgi:multiple sugar transport system permease protein
MVHHRGIGHVLRATFLIILMASWLLPTLMMVTNSFSADKDFNRVPPSILPKEWSLDNYRELMGLKLLPRWIGNTALVMITQVVGSILINGAAAYVFAFHTGRWTRWLFWAFMCPIFVSSYVLLVPQFVVFGKLGMIGLPAVALPGVWSTGIFLFRNYFKSIPFSLIESARIDGAGEWLIFRKVVLPLSGPVLSSASVLLAMGAVGSYVWPMLNLRVAEMQTYLVGLMASAINVYAVKNVGKDLAIGVMCMVPYFVIFAFANRYFIGGLTLGALKE